MGSSYSELRLVVMKTVSGFSKLENAWDNFKQLLTVLEVAGGGYFKYRDMQRLGLSRFCSQNTEKLPRLTKYCQKFPKIKNLLTKFFGTFIR